jgi:hypothetical protein
MRITSAGTGPGSTGAVVEQQLGVLRGLHALLTCYLPVILSLGYKVRSCTWQGQPGGTANGQMARTVLQHCLLVQTHVLRDWDAREEYTRTIALALLTWTPWLSKLPGCCFVEEMGEAMLSRLTTRCRGNAASRTFEGTFDLFSSLPPADRRMKATKGQLRVQLVQVMTARLRHLVDDPGSVPFARVLSAKKAQWEADWPVPVPLADALPAEVDSDLMEQVFRSAIVTMTRPQPATEGVTDYLDAEVPLVNEEEYQKRVTWLDRRVAQWRRERTSRAAAERGPGAVRRGRRPAAAPGQASQEDALGSQVPLGSPVEENLGMVPSQGSADGAMGADDAQSSQYEPPDVAPPSPGAVSAGETSGLGSLGDLGDWPEEEDAQDPDVLGDMS